MTNHIIGHTFVPLALAIGWIGIAALIAFGLAACIMRVTRR